MRRPPGPFARLRSAPRSGPLVAAVAVAILLTSCTGGDPEPAPPSASATPSPSASQVASQVESTEVVGSATGTVEKGNVEVAVRSLTLDPNGTTMTLRVAYTPDFVAEEGVETFGLSAMNGYFFLHPVLLDRTNLKRYSVIKGEGPQDWLANDDAKTRVGEPLEYWAVYAAPEDPVTSMTFTIDEWGVEIPDIPIVPAS
jgi:hypothetical protein